MIPQDAAQRPTGDFHQRELLFTDPLQHDYELICPVVLFAELLATRSMQTGFDRTTVSEKARRFIQQGMLGLAERLRIGRIRIGRMAYGRQ